MAEAQNMQTAIMQDDERIANALMRSLMARNQEDQNVIKWQLDLTYTIGNILVNAGGYFYEKESNTLYKRDKPSMNSRGILRLSEILNNYLNKDLIQSNYSLNEIKRVVLDLRESIILEFSTNAEEYGIDETMFPTTINMIDDMVFCTLKRAYEDGTRKHLETYLRFEERVREQQRDHSDKSIFENG